ncbi:MAG: hypothetical protein QOG15_169 [Solirubrobacteraceae bacterium]|jgi:hypothetical protein|nr:hypothetical protein [Solirubrobacteraceae bacterium]
MSWCPDKADDIEISEVEDGYVIYHPSRDRVHHLNHTAVLVLELCTGSNEAQQISLLLQEAYELAAPPQDEIAACLERLRGEGLIV